VVEQLRARFLGEIGGLNQDPGKPEYLTRWQKSQPEFDSLLRWSLGTELYQKLQVQAYAAAHQSEAEARAE
jgi:hypothetical protein